MTLTSKTRAFLRLQGYSEAQVLALSQWAATLVGSGADAWQELIVGGSMGAITILAQEFKKAMSLEEAPSDVILQMASIYGPVGTTLLLILAQSDAARIAQYIVSEEVDPVSLIALAVEESNRTSPSVYKI